MGYAHMKKKGEAGEIKKYISRTKAMRKLQLSLQQFHRLCIANNIFPIEPKHRIRVQGGSSKFRQLYKLRDIKFLLHDPNILNYREEDRLAKKITSAKGLHAVTKLATLRKNKPLLRYEHNLKQRYPSFVDAIKDLPDCLINVFLFAQVAAHHPIKEHHITQAQRLVTQFLTYVIEARCLSKAFIATDGIYFEVEILKQRVVWKVPHSCVTTIPVNVDLDIMKHYLEFHLAMLARVNQRLLAKVDLRYPLKPAVTPTLSGKERKDLDNYKNLIESLNYPLERIRMKEEDDGASGEATKNIKNLLKRSTEETRKAYTPAIDKELRRELFRGRVFFISRECNRAMLTFMIRACGGKVGWDNATFPCSSYSEGDTAHITHQIVDRPAVDIQHISRFYVQPAYVFDCINAATLLPEQKYFPGATLPPHVSPFLSETEGWYVPPEEETLRKLLEADPAEKEKILKALEQEEQEKQLLMDAARQEKENAMMEDESEEEEEAEEGEESKVDSAKEGEEAKEDTAAEEDAVDVDMDAEEETLAKHGEKTNRRGKERLVLSKWEKKVEDAKEVKMKEKMMSKADRKIYHSLKRKEQKVEKKASRLKNRRELIEKEKIGLATKEEVDYPVIKKAKKTMKQKRAIERKKKVSAANKFAKKEQARYKEASKTQTKKND